MNLEKFVENIQKYCDCQGISVAQALRESGLSRAFVANVRAGSVPSTDKVQTLAQYFGVTTSELLGETSPEYDQGLSPRAAALVAALDRLNDEGQEKLVDYADDLVSSGKYKKAGPAGLGKKA